MSQSPGTAVLDVISIITSLTAQGKVGPQGPKGNDGLRGPPGPSAAMPARFAFVAKSGSDTTGNGGLWNPYLTIQHAVDEVAGVPADQADYETAATVYVVGNGWDTVYAESVVIPTRSAVTILFLGGAIVNGKVTFDWTNADRHGSAVAPSVVIDGVAGGYGYLDFEQAPLFGIGMGAGRGLEFDNDAGDPIVAVGSLRLGHCVIGSAVDVNSNTRMTGWLGKVRFGSVLGNSIDLPECDLYDATECYIAGLVSLRTSQTWRQCRFFGDVTSGGGPGDVTDLVNCKMEGGLKSFTTGANLRIDGYTQDSALRSNWNMSGNTLVITDRPWLEDNVVPEGAITASPGALYLDNGDNRFWLKRQLAGNTGWEALAFDLRTPDVAWVSKAGDDATATGSTNWPFLTIQAAIDDVNAIPTNQADFLRPRVIHVIGPGTWVENLTLHTCAHVQIIFHGQAIVDGTVTYDMKDAERFGSFVYPSVSISGDVPLVQGTNAELYAFQVGNGATSFTAKFDVADLVDFCEINFNNLWCAGVVTYNGAGCGGYLRFRDCYVDASGTHSVNWPRTAGVGTGAEIVDTFNTSFIKQIASEYIDDMDHCFISDHVTVQGTSAATKGITNTRFINAKNWNGPALSARLDPTSEWWFNNSWTLVAPATMTRINKLTQEIHEPVPETIAGNTNDWAPSTKSSFHRITFNGAFNITGIVAAQTGVINYAVNVSANTGTFKHLDAGSAAANQIIGINGADVVVPQNAKIAWVYDGSTGKNRILWVTL